MGQVLTGALFAVTVGRFPRAILLLSAALHALPFLLLFFVRLPGTHRA